MTITIELSDEALRRLREKAAAAGRPLEEYVRAEVESLAAGPRDPFLGFFSQDDAFAERLIEDVMTARETESLRAGDDAMPDRH